MYTVKDSVHINAPLERCFLLSTSIDFAWRSFGLRPVSGKTSGNAVLGDTTLWRCWFFGLPQTLQVTVTAFEQPNLLQQTMDRGPFKQFQHRLHFAEVDGRAFLHDKVHFALPFGWLGKTIERRLVVPFVARLLRRRFELLKMVAESEEWRRYIPERKP